MSDGGTVDITEQIPKIKQGDSVGRTVATVLDVRGEWTAE